MLRKKKEKNMDVFAKMDLCAYVANMESYDKMVQCFVFEQNQVIFHEIQFRKIRYGFDPATFKLKFKEDEAARMLQKWFRRSRNKEQEKIRRKKPGYLTLSGVIRSGELILVYSMLANKG